MCIYVVLSLLESTEGGPSKAELLDLLQHCEVGGASRMSSAVSSRAPSPSPSLMSIIYPGLKPVSGRDSHSGTPLSTPQLGRMLHTSPSANMFQPIHTSHSNNSLIAPEAVVPPSSLATVSTKKHSPEVSEPDHQQEKQEAGRKTSEVETTRTISSHSSPVHNTPPTVESSTHQRSRSNEIEYILSSRSSAFRSPSDASSFRPLSVDSTPFPKATPKDSISSTSTEGERSRLGSTGERSRLGSTDERSRLGSAGERSHQESTGDNWSQLGSAGSTWRKENDSSIISEYFGLSEQIEQYLRSDEPLLPRVTDC